MTYSTTNPPRILRPSSDGEKPTLWSYASPNSLAEVAATGFIADAANQGMRVNDIVIVYQDDGDYNSGTFIVFDITDGEGTLQPSRAAQIDANVPGSVPASAIMQTEGFGGYLVGITSDGDFEPVQLIFEEGTLDANIGEETLVYSDQGLAAANFPDDNPGWVITRSRAKGGSTDGNLVDMAINAITGGRATRARNDGTWSGWNFEQDGFANRDAFVAAANDGVMEGTVVSAGRVSFQKKTGATTFPDKLGWVPFGDVYLDHWQENITQYTTDMSAAFTAAAAYCQPLLKTINLLPGTAYRIVAGSVRLSTRFFTLDCPGASGSTRATLWITGDLATDGILCGPLNATTPATAVIANYSFNNVVIQRSAAGSTAAGIRCQKISGLQFNNVDFFDFKWGALIEGCYNTDFRNCNGSVVSFAGASGSAIIKLDHLLLTDASYFEGFTCRIKGGRMTGTTYDAILLVASNDYTEVSGVYWGGTNCKHVLLKPGDTSAKIYDLIVDNAYFDGVITSSTATAIAVEGNGASSPIGPIKASNTILGQMDRAVSITGHSNFFGNIEFVGCDFHYSAREFIYVDSTSSANAQIRVTGGNMTGWWAFDTADVAHYAVNVAAAYSVALSDVTFTGAPANPVGNIGTVTSLLVADNIMKNVLSNFDLGTVTHKSITGNISSVLLGDDSTESNRTTWTPVLAFGGASVGVTYASQIGRYTISQKRCFYSIYVQLSSKGSSTGTLTISLPFSVWSVMASPAAIWCAPGVAATGIGYAALAINSTSTLQVRRMKDDGGQAALTNSDVTDTAFFSINGFFDLT